MTSISKDQALAICDQLRDTNRRKWFTYQSWWCWGCTTFTSGDVDKRCFANTPDNRGCEQVNQHYDRSKPT